MCDTLLEVTTNATPCAINMKSLCDIRVLLHKHIYSKNDKIKILQNMFSNIIGYDPFEIMYDEAERAFNIRISKATLKKMKKEIHVNDTCELNKYISFLIRNRLHEFITMNKKEMRAIINLAYKREERESMLKIFNNILTVASLTTHLFHFFPMEDNYYMIKL